MPAARQFSVIRRPTEPLCRQVLAWREAASSVAAWRHFQELSGREEWAHQVDVPAPEWDDWQSHHFASRLDDDLVVVCEKMVVQRRLESAWAGRELTFAFDQKVSTAWISPSITRRSAMVMQRTAKARRLRLAFLGDLDPDAIFQFACLRAGGREALLRSRPTKLDVTWVYDARMFNGASEGGVSGRPAARRILAREYWELVKRLVPHVEHLIGRRAHRLLDSGHKLEMDSLCHDDAFDLRGPLRARLRAIRRVPA